MVVSHVIMADIVSSTILRYAVTALFTMVFDAAGRAIQCKEDCKPLQASLKGIIAPLFMG